METKVKKLDAFVNKAERYSANVGMQAGRGLTEPEFKELLSDFHSMGKKDRASLAERWSEDAKAKTLLEAFDHDYAWYAQRVSGLAFEKGWGAIRHLR